MKYEFPEGFLWGVATAATQVEGAAFADGKGPSIWDVFSRIPGKIKGGDTTDVTCDQYHLYEKDIQLMHELGVKSYRFSFSWSRIIPDGNGEVNPAGIAYYKKLIACLKKYDIVPNATIYHWDLPYSLQIMGGFGNRKIVDWYKHYVSVLFDYFGDDVDMWVTFNEPIAVYVGHANGVFAPGLKDECYARQCIHNLLVCHGEAVKMFRQRNFKKAKIGIVVDVWPHYPSRPGNPEDEALVTYNNECAGYGMLLHPLFLGGYSKELTAYMQEHDMMPAMEPGDFDTIKQKLDFYGLNFYNGIYDCAEIEKREITGEGGGNFQNESTEGMQKNQYDCEALYRVLHMLIDKYHIDIPIYLTENGVYAEDEQVEDGTIHDDARIAYLEEVLYWLHKGISDGIPVKGYFLWSLLDNWEWSAGFSLRFGIVRVDYGSQQRIIKDSGRWYSKVMKDNALEYAK